MTMVDFSQLPQPAILQALDVEADIARRKNEIIARAPADMRAALSRTLALESEPLTILTEHAAYSELVFRARVNDAWRASTLVYATGADLDNLAAGLGVQRLVLIPADDTTTPPTPAVYESDARLRLRAQLAWETLAIGSADYYTALALAHSAQITDVWVYSPAPVEVRVVALAGDAAPSDALLDSLQTALRGGRASPTRSLTDHVITEPAKLIRAQLIATLTLAASTGAELIVAAARRAFLDALAAGDARERQVRLGQIVDKSMVYAALRQPGVLRVETDFADDIVCAQDTAVVFDMIEIRWETR